MLFRKEIPPRCAYCAHGTTVEEDTVLCLKKGVTSEGDSCHSFRYDPFKRTPPPQATLDTSRLKEEDFSLDIE